MRLTDEVLRASDQSTLELVGSVVALAAAGRYGLLPAVDPFVLSVNVAGGLVDVVALNCVAVTRGGDLIEARYDTRYTNAFDTRVALPDDATAREYILTINAHQERWADAGDGFEQPVYTFALQAPDTPIGPHAFPIGRIVDSEFGGWRIDDVDFIPPCMFVTAHPKYVELLAQFRQLLSRLDKQASELLHSEGKNAMRIFWPAVQRLMITVDKEGDVMTPMSLLASVQQCVSAFTCACDLDDYLELDGAEEFRSYILRPYSYKQAHQTIKQGLDICFQISEKVDKLKAATPAAPAPGRPAAPTINPSELVKHCTNTTARITLINNAPGATVYYTTDGSDPSESSKSGLKISLENGFNNLRKREPDKVVTIKAIAIVDGDKSAISSFEVTMKKDIARWTGIEI